MPGPLEGIRVVDFGQYLAGPATALLLADQGAEVTHIDPPGGPLWDVPADAALQRGKRRERLDLKHPEGLERARELIASADVMIENFRPGVMERLGLGAEASLATNPRLLYCSLPGFASDDPRASMPAWEGVIAAATDTYRPPRDGDGPPVYTAVPIASMFAAFTAANSIAAALYSRELDGRGQRIEVPLFDAMFGAIGANGLRVDGAPAGGRPNDFAAGTAQASDGRWVQYALAKPSFIEHLVRAAGLGERFPPAELAERAEARQRLFAALPEIFATRTADEWERIGVEADVPLIRVRSAEEWMRDEHALASRTFIDVDDERHGRLRQPNAPLRLTLGDAEVPPVTASATPRRAALEGVRVIDLSLVLAGPLTGRTLAEFGADVIKVNPPAEPGAGIQFNRHRYHTDVNRGKRSIFLDLKREEDREVFWRLLDDADIVVHNFRPGVLERLGIDYGTARRRKPGIIYAGVSAYGSPGPWSALGAYEPFGQAATGMSARQGGDGRPLMQPFAVNDYGTGMLGAFAALVALVHRARTGAGAATEAALAYTGTFLQLPHLLLAHLLQAEDRSLDAAPRGPGALGSRPLHRLYRTADGWFFLGGHEDQREIVLSVLGLDAASTESEEAFVSALERHVGERTVAHCCESFTAAGLGAHRLVDLDELMFDPWVVKHGLSLTREHDTGEVITTTGPAPRLSHTPVVPGRPAPTPGSDAASVLGAVEA